MYRPSLLLLSLLPAATWGSPARSAQSPPLDTDWRKRGSAFYEELLLTAEFVDAAPVGKGRLRPGRIYLRQGNQRIEAIFKSVDPGPRQEFSESHQTEVAAYEMDKLLGLGLVPPTVLRQVEGKAGSVQLWLDNSREWEESAQEPSTLEWKQSLYRTRMFDELIGNRDRRGNILIDPVGNMSLIDHSRAFIPDKELSQSPPPQFDRNLVAKLRALDRRQLSQAFGSLLSAQQIGGLLARRDLLLAHVDRLTREKGEAAVLF